jgi:hypothetical protein
MDDIVLSQFMIKDKKEQIKKLHEEIYILKRESEDHINNYIKNNRDTIIQEDIHYINNHIIDAFTDYYYDYDWYYNKYYTKNPVNKFGFLPTYEGPDKILYISCEECDIHLNKPYKDTDNTDLIFLAKDKFDDHILQKKIKELST